MQFLRNDGASFELMIVSYQFPDLEHAEYDSNWLNIRIQVQHSDGYWAMTDPSLLTYEVAWLAAWLEQIAAGNRSQLSKFFTEPNLEFHLGTSINNGEVVKVCFALEFSPPWASREPSDDKEYCLEFPLLDLDLLEAARSLRKQLSNYPQRAAR